MEKFDRKAGVLWSGDLRSGAGVISTESQALFEIPFNYRTRFDGQPGTNPEELIAAAHAACFSMTLADILNKNGFEPQRTDTSATCSLESKNGGDAITHMRLHVRAEIPDIDEETFQNLILEADQACPVSNLLKNSLQLEITATLNERSPSS